MLQKIIFGALTVFISSISFSTTQAAGFPEKEMKIIVNYGAGGAVGRTARSVQRFLPEEIGKSVLVENHKGAGGKIGIKKYMKTAKDGYTLLTTFAPATTYVSFKNPKLFKLSDLAIINVQWSDPAIIIANKDTGWKSMDDMIKAVKANPGKFSFGSSGKSAVGALLSRILFKKLGLKVKIVPYKGGGKTRAAYKGGHVHMTGAGAGGALSVRKMSVVLGAFWDGPVAGWPKAKPINPMIKKYGVSVPNGGAYRFHAVHRDVKTKHPKRWKKIVKAFKDVTTKNKGFQKFAKKTRVGKDWLGPKKSEALMRKVEARFMKILQENLK